MEQQEKKVIADIKKMAKAGQMVSFDPVEFIKIVDQLKKNSTFGLRFWYILIPGCCENNGKRSCQNSKIREKIHYDEGQYPGSVSQSSGGILIIIIIII